MLEKEIADLEKEKAKISEELNSGNKYFEELQTLAARIGKINVLLEEKEMRWLEFSEYSS